MLLEIATAAFDIPVRFTDFAQFWQAQTPAFSEVAKVIAGLDKAHARLAPVRAEVCAPPGSCGAYMARADAVRAHVPD